MKRTVNDAASVLILLIGMLYSLFTATLSLMAVVISAVVAAGSLFLVAVLIGLPLIFLAAIF